MWEFLQTSIHSRGAFLSRVCFFREFVSREIRSCYPCYPHALEFGKWRSWCEKWIWCCWWWGWELSRCVSFTVLVLCRVMKMLWFSEAGTYYYLKIVTTELSGMIVPNKRTNKKTAQPLPTLFWPSSKFEIRTLMNGGMMEKIAMATMKMVHLVYIIKHNIYIWSSSSHAKTSD